MSDLTHRFLELLEQADQPAAVGLVTGLADQGATPEALVLEVLAPAQREVGRRWEDGRWSVAQEHAATAVTDIALGLLALEAEPSRDGRHAVVACVEGEWHAMPARMAAEVLRLRGWHVTFLGPSLPADDLARYVARERPDVVGLSCSMPVSLKGAARSIEGCRHAGVPVLAGGSGFGPAGRYAARVGASAWAPDPVAGAEVAGVWLDGAPPGAPPPEGARDEEHVVLEREKGVLVEEAVAMLDRDDPRVRDALTYALSTVESAIFVQDPGVVTACRPAIERLLATGNTPCGPSALDALVRVMHARLPRSSALLAEAHLSGVDLDRSRRDAPGVGHRYG